MYHQQPSTGEKIIRKLPIYRTSLLFAFTPKLHSTKAQKSTIWQVFWLISASGDLPIESSTVVLSGIALALYETYSSGTVRDLHPGSLLIIHVRNGQG